MELVTNIDENKIDRYFESIRSVFYTKLVSEILLFDDKGRGKLCMPNDVFNCFEKTFKDFKAYTLHLYNGDGAIRDNFHDNMLSSIIIDSWVVFELIIKDLTQKDYSKNENDISMDYKAKKFGFSKNEKANLDLFYYIRNSYVHYNGAFHASKKIDHTYEGIHFVSEDHEGEQIEIKNVTIAYKMHLDMNEYAKKAWRNSKSLNSRIK